MDAGALVPGPNCVVSSGPAYNFAGTVPVNHKGGRKRAPFAFSAAFEQTPPGAGEGSYAPSAQASCCQVTQMIKWDRAYAHWHGRPPHGGFPASAAADTWIEDRDPRHKRYGHRNDAYTDPQRDCVDEYTTDGKLNMENGDTYCGKDFPDGPEAMTGQYQFRLLVIDTCNGEALKGSSGVITVNW
jgi:hypothetical protein